MVTNNKTIVNACERCKDYPTIVNCFEKSTKRYKNTLENLANIDNLLQENQKGTGTSSNVAQLLLSEAWDTKDKETRDKLLDNVAILSVLAQACIDSAKRQFIIGKDGNGINKEIARIRKEIACGLKPTFWQYTSKAFTNEEIAKKLKAIDKEVWKILSKEEQKEAVKTEKKKMIDNLYDFECPMNWILEETKNIDEKKKANRAKDVNFLVESVKMDKTLRRKAERQCKAIEELVEEFDKATKFINVNDDMEDEEVQKYYGLLYDEYFDKISKKKLCSEAMYMLIRRALDNSNKSAKSNSYIKTKLLNMLFRMNKDEFLKCFKCAK